MNKCCNRIGWLASLIVGLVVAQSSWAMWQPSDEQLVRDVLSRLFAVAEPPAGDAWPPSIRLIDTGEVNACAFNQSRDPNIVKPGIAVYRGLMEKIIKGEPDRLAFVLGHEIGHILRGHIADKPEDPKNGTMFLHRTFTREQELEADQEGIRLAMKAGYSFRGCVGGMKAFIDANLDYSAFRGQGLDHPSWKERLAIIDKDHAKIWTAMASFHSGVDLLAFEDFGPAAACFEQVTKEFPECSEAWANLGYAKLMQYCDSLTTDDLRRLGIHQMVIGGFYTRPAWLMAQVQRGDPKLWAAARGALEKSLRLKPDLALAKANLGVAWLVAPEGKDPARASRLLQEAAREMNQDRDLAPSVHAAVLVNTAVAEAAAGNDEVSLQRFNQARQIAERLAGAKIATLSALSSAMLYNRAMELADATAPMTRAQSVGAFEDYFKRANPASAWWPLAYERYAAMCQEQHIAPKPAELLRAQAAALRRPVTQITTSSGVPVTLGESLDEVAAAMKSQGQRVPLVPGTKLVSIVYPEQGIRVVGIDRVLAISVFHNGSPGVMVRGAEAGSQPIPIHVGMKLQDFDKIVGEQRIAFEPVFQKGVKYTVYRDLQIALRSDEGIITEIVVALIPETPKIEKE